MNDNKSIMRRISLNIYLTLIIMSIIIFPWISKNTAEYVVIVLTLIINSVAVIFIIGSLIYEKKKLN